MTKLLVINPQNIQQLIEVGQGGGYFDPTRVLWDEREDGEFPAALLEHVGGLKRTEERSENGTLLLSSLAFDQETKDADDAAKAALEPSADEKRRIAYMAIPEHEFREAVYEARKGDTTKFDAYDAKVQEIKQQFPKG